MEGLIGGIYRYSEWIMRLAYINILWILFTLLGLVVFGGDGIDGAWHYDDDGDGGDLRSGADFACVVSQSGANASLYCDLNWLLWAVLA